MANHWMRLLAIMVAAMMMMMNGCGKSEPDNGDDDPDTVYVDSGKKGWSDDEDDVTENPDDDPDADDDDADNGDDEPDDDEPSPAPFKGTTGATSGPSTRNEAPDMNMPILIGVRTGTHSGYDRIVFEFSGQGVPAWDMEYVDKPVHECGSGNQRFLAGDGWLEMRFHGANMHTEEGAATVKARDRKPGLPNIKQLTSTCDFEAEVVWVAGVSSPNEYRTAVLSNPSRIVVDIKHGN